MDRSRVKLGFPLACHRALIQRHTRSGKPLFHWFYLYIHPNSDFNSDAAFQPKLRLASYDFQHFFVLFSGVFLRFKNVKVFCKSDFLCFLWTSLIFLHCKTFWILMKFWEIFSWFFLDFLSGRIWLHNEMQTRFKWMQELYQLPIREPVRGLEDEDITI